MHHGSCLCQGVTFRVSGDLPPIQVCHCSQCRRAQGGPVATNMAVDETQVNWLSGQELFQFYESSPGKVRCFCRVCGSPLFSRRESLPGVLRLRAGLFNEPLQAQVGWHFYCASQASWWPGRDDVPHYDEKPPVQ